MKKTLEEKTASAPTTYWHWSGIPTFLRCPHDPDFKNTDIGLIGVPYSGGNSIERMQYLAPRAVRNRSSAYHRAHRQFGIDPFDMVRVSDLGDAPLPHILNPDKAAEDIESFYKKVFEAGITPVTIGGDHSVTWPILRASRKTKFSEPIGMIHFDSHTDAAPEGFGTRNHAAGFLLGTEDGLIDPKRTVQIGIRGHMAILEMDDWAKNNFAAVISTDDVANRGTADVIKQVREIIGNGPVYISFDLDALDPSYAPAVADPEVNGLTLREVTNLIHGFRGLNFMGADIVCYCPPIDNPSQITALTISSMMLDFVSLIAENLSGKK
ncbi:MAG TPA: arginase family protein [Ignavibacteria bacterium]|nr:arginase family protein [Ignavibacteria bacterium]